MSGITIRRKVTCKNMAYALRMRLWFSTILIICLFRIAMKTGNFAGKPSALCKAFLLFWSHIRYVLKAEEKSSVSLAHERRTAKRGAVMSIVKHKRGSAPEVSARRVAELKALAEKPDAEIDYSDIPATDDELWSGAVRGKFYRPLKTQASVRIDADVMEWLKRPGKGYQTRLNAILREAMLRDQNKK